MSWQHAFNSKDYFITPTTWLQTVGSWKLDFSRLLPNSIKFFASKIENLRRLLSIMLLFHLEIVLCVSTYQTIIKHGPFGAFILILNTMIYLWNMVIWLFFAHQAENLKELFAIMNKNFRQRSAPGLTYVSFESGYKRARKMLNYCMWCCIITGGAYGMVPLMNGKQELPLPTWYPFDLSIGHRFEAVFGLQYLCQLLIGMIFANGLAFSVYLFMLFTSQLDILCASIKNIPFTALIKAGKDKRTLQKLQNELKNTYQELNQYSLGDEIELLEDLEKYELKNKNFILTPDTFKDPIVVKYLKESIADCVLHHQTIIELIGKVEQRLSVFLFFKLWYKCILMTFILFVLTVIDDPAQIAAFMNYLAVLIIGLFMINYFGQIFTLQSEKIINAVMNSPWHLYMVPVKKELLILLARGTQPYVLSAGGFMNISMGTFIAVVRATFSYYTLLIKLNKNH